MGNQPIDDGNYLFSEEERNEFLKLEPKAAPYFRKWYGSQEFIAQKPRYCLWLGDCPAVELAKLPECRKRIEAVRAYRAASKRAATRKLADRPRRFQTENMPAGPSILIPKVSSEKRLYVPMGFMSPDDFCSDAAFLIPNATLYHFGVLTSSVHMAWMRAICGRLEMRYRYSINLVYNNFPWPENADEKLQKQIETAAEKILKAREAEAGASLATLYNDAIMPDDLRAAHKANDKLVMKAYGFRPDMNEAEVVGELLKMYKKKIN